MSERVVVTGAAGFIGSHVVDALLARGDTVLGIDNFDPFYREEVKRANVEAALVNPRFTLVEADIRDDAGMRRALGEFRPEIVLHFAAKAGVRPSIADPAGYADVNVRGTAVILEAARQAGTTRVVAASSSSVYGNSSQPPFREDDAAVQPVSPYAATKRAAELVCESHAQLYPEARVISLRLFTVYGPRQRPDLAIHKFTRLMLAGSPVPFFGDGSDSRDYTFIGDILQGILGAVERTRSVSLRHEIFNLGESATTTLSELVTLLEQATGCRAILDRQPAQLGDVRRTCADISRARALLGYRPGVAVAEGVRQFVSWYRAMNGPDVARRASGIR